VQSVQAIQVPVNTDSESGSKPYAPACDRNRDPILSVLHRVLPEQGQVLEIGSGTGQHAAFFSAALPHLQWLPSDLPPRLSGITQWCDQSGNDKCLAPVAIDLLRASLSLPRSDAIVCINIVHIVAWAGVQNLFKAARDCLSPGQVLYLYGPYRYADRPFEPSNEEFDRWLKVRDPLSGVRDFDTVRDLAASCAFDLSLDLPMPSNNRSLCFTCSED